MIPAFRAWDKQDKRMIEINFWEMDHEVMPVNGDWDDAVTISDEERFIWLQYSGLDDKNQKWIYEGDIVQWTSHYKKRVTGDRLAEPAIGVVCWDHTIDEKQPGRYKYSMFGSGAFHFYDKWDSRRQMFNWKDLEVIGNVHENADLLKEATNEK